MDPRRMPWLPGYAAHRVVILMLILTALLAACGSGGPALTGTDLQMTPAPDFTLTDQHGKPFQLSSVQGKAVALAFIYTNCPDICPLITQHLKAAYQQLPADAQGKVALIAVTVDPEHDTPEVLQEYSRKHQVADITNWHALTSDRATLTPVWRNYAINPLSPGKLGDPSLGTGSTTPGPDDIQSHTDAIYIIDPQGRERVLMHSDSDPAAIANNLKALVG